MTGCRPTGGTPIPPSAEADDDDTGRAAAPVVAVAYSGGCDSTALLHATLAAAGDIGVQVLALHVHHGLSPNADAWLAHCQGECRRWAAEGRRIAFAFQRLNGRPTAGQSVEAWARRERYAALQAMALAHGATLVLLAHHRQDQAETWLLQALRAGGVAGLAAMPSAAERDGIRWLRPWLQRPRSEIEAYVQRHRLTHIEDESNADPRFARNRLRLEVWPGLTSAFPDAEAALAQAAGWAQQAAAALAELAQSDLAAVTDADGLLVDRWVDLSDARRSNSLRAWLAARGGDSPPTAAMTLRLMAELPHARTGRWQVEAGELRLHRGVLRHVALPPAPEGCAAGRREAGREEGKSTAGMSTASMSKERVSPKRPSTEGVSRKSALRADLGSDSLRKERVLHIDRAANYLLAGWNGSLSVRPVEEGGVPLAWLAQVELRPRCGGERFQAGIGRPPRSLKKQFQASGVAPWDRDGPLIFSGGQLVYVPGLGLDARVVGLPGQSMVELQWQAGGASEPREAAG